MDEKINQVAPIVSLCIPTNGITEWVIPVLDSIYRQGVPLDQFEVVVTNNGENRDFDQVMTEYAQNHANMVYQKNTSYMFYNQIESLKLARGKFLKFVNHRGVFPDGSLAEMIDIVEQNSVNKPVIFFSNGEIPTVHCGSFDEFVASLKRYASWTTGVGIWKEEFDRIKDDLVIDKISPHSCILFSNRTGQDYRIYDLLFSQEIDSDHSKKGSYDLFKAFGVEELAITQKLYIDGDISADTLKAVKKDYRVFLSDLYWEFCLRKKPCSYDLSGFDDAMGIYFRKGEVIRGAYVQGIRRVFSKVFKRSK